jgi:hypothetical protein
MVLGSATARIFSSNPSAAHAAAKSTSATGVDYVSAAIAVFSEAVESFFKRRFELDEEIVEKAKSVAQKRNSQAIHRGAEATDSGTTEEGSHFLLSTS